MGLLDDAKGFVEEHEEQVEDGIEKVAELVDDKTGGKHTEQIEGAADKAKDTIAKLVD